LGAASDVERDARQSMQERESGVLAFGLGLRRACEGAWGRAKCVGWRWKDEAKDC
jgi:hypothetical protein